MLAAVALLGSFAKAGPDGHSTPAGGSVRQRQGNILQRAFSHFLPLPLSLRCRRDRWLLHNSIQAKFLSLFSIGFRWQRRGNLHLAQGNNLRTLSASCAADSLIWTGNLAQRPSGPLSTQAQEPPCLVQHRFSLLQNIYNYG